VEAPVAPFAAEATSRKDASSEVCFGMIPSRTQFEWSQYITAHSNRREYFNKNTGTEFSKP
jgi:glucuronate isomerase